MAFTYGCYNYNENDAEPKLYDAVQVSRIFDGIITDGVYARVGQCFAVKAPADRRPNTVIISSGRAWFDHTWNYNSSDIFAGRDFDAPPLYPDFYDRIDALVIDINNEARENKFLWVKGEEATTPVKPTLTNTTNHHQHAIAYITRHPHVTVISSGDIERVVGTAETPYVTGVLESLDASELLAGIQSDFEVMMSGWESTIESDISSWTSSVNQALIGFQTDFNYQQSQFSDEFTEFITGANAFLRNSRSDFASFMSDSLLSFNQLLNTSQSTFASTMAGFRTEFNSLKGESKDDFDEFMDAIGGEFIALKTDMQTEFSTAIASYNSQFSIFVTNSNRSVNDLMAQFRTTFNTWFESIQGDYGDLIASDTQRFNTWFSGIQDDYDELITADTQRFETWFNGLQPTFNLFISTNQSTFDTWLAGVNSSYESLIAQDRAAFDTWFAAAKKQFDDWFAEISEEFVGSATLTREGTASATSVSTQNLIINNSVKYEVSGSSYMQQTQTLSTTADTTYTFTNSKITGDSYIEVATDKNINYKSISVSSGTCSVIFGPHSTAIAMAVRIYIRND